MLKFEYDLSKNFRIKFKIFIIEHRIIISKFDMKIKFKIKTDNIKFNPEFSSGIEPQNNTSHIETPK